MFYTNTHTCSILLIVKIFEIDIKLKKKVNFTQFKVIWKT